MSKAKVSWLLCIGRLVSKTDNVMHFARLVEQASATGFCDLFVFGAYTKFNLEYNAKGAVSTKGAVSDH